MSQVALPADLALFAALQRAVAGRYSLEREIGRGGMGMVFAARDVRLDRSVALKLLRPELARHPTARARFLAEARLAAGLAHPNIVPIHEVDEQGDLLWYAMTLVRGRSLGDQVRTVGPLSSAEMGRVLRETAWALSYAHGRGIVHRDIKPDNIFLETGGRVLVLDFGIAQREGSVGEAIGTVGFLPPEQRLPGPPDPRSDLYALAITAASVLTGKVPAGPAEAAQVIRVRAPWAADTLERCLAEEPDRRPESARLVAEGLEPPAAQPIAPEVRRWMAEAGPLRSVLMAWTVFLGTTTLLSLGYAGTSFTSGAVSTFAPWLLLAWPLRLYQTRRLLATGLGISDIRRGLAEQLRLRKEEFRGRTVPPARRTGSVVAQIGLGTTFSGVIGRLFIGMTTEEAGVPIVFGIALVVVGAIISSAEAGRKKVRRDAVLERRVALWSGVLGALNVHLAGVGLPAPRRGGVRGPLSSRPTEVLLGRSIRDLAADLPPAVRAQFPGLEDQVDRLEQGAERLGVQAAQFEAQANSTPAKRVALLDGALRLRRQRTEMLASLDGLRMALIAVRGGTEEIGAVTMGLEDALAVAERVQHLAEARAELKEL